MSKWEGNKIYGTARKEKKKREIIGTARKEKKKGGSFESAYGSSPVSL